MGICSSAGTPHSGQVMTERSITGTAYPLASTLGQRSAPGLRTSQPALRGRRQWSGARRRPAWSTPSASLDSVDISASPDQESRLLDSAPSRSGSACPTPHSCCQCRQSTGSLAWRHLQTIVSLCQWRSRLIAQLLHPVCSGQIPGGQLRCVPYEQSRMSWSPK